MLQPTPFGYASLDDVDEAITARLANVNADNKEDLARVLGEAIAALGDINKSIPVYAEERHLIAGTLEGFCNNNG